VWLAALAGFVFLLVYVSIRAAAHSTITHDADAIILLGAGQWDDRPSDAMSARCTAAALLYHQGRAPLIIATGGNPGTPRSDAAVAAECLQSLGVPAKAIALEDASRSTVENLVNSRAIMGDHALRTAIIVSCPFHLLRARRIAQDLGMDVELGAAIDSPLERYPTLRVALTARETLAYLKYLAVDRRAVRHLGAAP
jgi:uncharacterized SAM-binding protein YcdF (DUF218 family)